MRKQEMFHIHLNIISFFKRVSHILNFGLELNR
nr:MAG TPA: protein of unknown function UPF0058 [Caudoviricetes sp.]